MTALLINLPMPENAALRAALPCTRTAGVEAVIIGGTKQCEQGNDEMDRAAAGPG